MSEPQSSWAFVGISPEARQAAELAAEEAGMELDTWLAQLIKYKSAMELKGRGAVSLDDAIMRISARNASDAQATAAAEALPTPGREDVTSTARPGSHATPSDDKDAAREEAHDPDDELPGQLPRKSLPTESLRPSRLSALNQADEEAIQNAFDSWRDNRTVEPLLVRPVENERNTFEVIVGVERWHAARRAHIRELPVIVHHATDEEAIRLGMSARLKRGPLSPLNEANTYLSLMSEAGMSTEQVARMVGKPPAHVATMVRVTSLPKAVRDMLERGEITPLHARVLLDAPNAEALAREVVTRRLDIYQTEQLVRTANLEAEQSEKVEFSAVDLDLTDGKFEEPSAPVADLDGETGFGPEHALGGETGGKPQQDLVEATSPFEADIVEDDLLLEGETGDDYDLVDSFEPPLMEALRDDTDLSQDDPAETEAPASPWRPVAANAAPSERQIDDAEPSERQPAAETGQPGTFERRPARRSAEPGRKGVVTTELLEHHLSHLLGLKVAISERDNVGVISLHYTSREELSDIVARLNSGSPR